MSHGVQGASSTSECLELLNLLVEMTNNVIGDALTDLLLVLSCLNYLQWSMTDWFHMYKDKVSHLAKVRVADRYALKVNERQAGDQ